MADYKPVYRPVFGLLLGNSQAYSEEVGTIDFKRVETIGDIRAKHITPKDTEIRQIGVREGSKTFKKYFLGNQFIQSELQNNRGNEDVVRMVLDEHNKQFEEIVSLGEGSADNNVVNNGLFWSGDPNHVTNESYEVLEDANDDYLLDLYKKILSVARTQADLAAGRKVVMAYGSNITPLFDSLFSTSQAVFRERLSQGLGADYSVMSLPLNLVASGANGFLIVNLDQIKMHYCALPSLVKRGTNEEKGYDWNNFRMGSAMIDVLTLNGIVKQPLTLSSL